MKMPPMAQWARSPREVLRVIWDPAPSSIPPAPTVFPPPTETSHCSTAGEVKTTELHFSQEKTPRTNSPEAEGTATLAELLPCSTRKENRFSYSELRTKLG